MSERPAKKALPWSLSTVEEIREEWELISGLWKADKAGGRPRIAAYPSSSVMEDIQKGCQEIAARYLALGTEVATWDPDLVRLKRRWNTSLPINYLPNELLLAIFTAYDADVFYDPHGSLELRETLPRICRYWYDFVRSCPEIWRFIDFKLSEKYRKHCLSISSTFPIRAKFSRYTFRETVSTFISSYSHRLEGLICSTGDTTWKPDIVPVFARGMPFLKILELRLASFMPQDDYIELDLTAKRYPLLRSLYLGGPIRMPRDVGIYENLRFLRLELSNILDVLSFEQFLDIIAASIKLEELHIEDYFESLDGSSSFRSTSRPRSPLPLMRHLTLSDSYMASLPRLSQFLWRFSLPIFSRIDMVAFMGNTSEVDGVVTFSAFLPIDVSVTHPMIPVATTAELYILAEYGDIGLACAAGSVRSTSSLQMRYSIRGLQRQDVDALFKHHIRTDLCVILGRSPLSSLEFNADIEICLATADWKNICDTFPLLEDIKLDQWSLAVGLWSALLPPSPPLPPDEAPDRIPCPRLRSLSMDGRACHISFGDVEVPKFLQAMLATLRERAARGARLEKLVLNVEHDASWDCWEKCCADHSGYRGEFMPGLEKAVTDVSYPPLSERKKD